jgi:hypothetical protein
MAYSAEWARGIGHFKIATFGRLSSIGIFSLEQFIQTVKGQNIFW